MFASPADSGGSFETFWQRWYFFLAAWQTMPFFNSYVSHAWKYIVVHYAPNAPPPPKKITFLMVHPLMDDSQVGAENIGIHGPTWIKTNKNTTEKQYRLDYCRYIFGWNIKGELFLQYPSTIPALGAPCPRGSTPDFKWREWSNGEKNQNPKKSLD